MKQKLSLLLLALISTLGAWATVTQPTLTTDENNPVYYKIGSYDRGGYLTYNGADQNLTHTAYSAYSLWYFMENGSGYSIIPAMDPSVKLATNSSATASGAVWYLLENPYNSGYFCITLNQDLTQNNCIDANNWSSGTGYWHPSEDDYAGVSWTIEPVEITKDEVFAQALSEKKALVVSRLNDLPSLSSFTEEKLAAVQNATNENELEAALEAYNTAITLLCRSNKYLQVGASTASFIDTPSEYNHAIEIVSAGDGSFYLKGFKSKAYMGDVQVSTAITTTATPDVPYLIQKYNEYTVIRPVAYANSGWSAGYHYVHNGGSGCVGWSSDGTNTQFTISEIELPADFVDVTYNVVYGGKTIATAVETQKVGNDPMVPASLARDYTTYEYNVTKIAAGTTTVEATPVFTGMPFELSSDYESAKWYFLHGHASYNNRYISTNGDAIVWAEGIKKTDAYMWTFMGNPVSGIKLVNKATGAEKNLMATNPATMGTTEKGWILKKQTNTGWQCGENGFGLYDASLTYLNTQNGTLKYWSSFDQGSSFWVDEVSFEDIFNDAIAALNSINWGTGVGQYRLTGDLAGKTTDEVLFAIQMLEEEGYTAENLAAAQALLANCALNMPTAGKFYRFQSIHETYLSGNESSNSTGRLSFTTTADASTIFYFDGYKLYDVANGRAANGREIGTAGSAGVDYWFEESSITAGKYVVRFNPGSGNNRYLYAWGADKHYADQNGGDAANCTFTIAEVTTLPVAVTEAGYATLYAPVALTIPEGVTAYTGVINGEWLSMTEVDGGVIPAETAVVLEAAEGSYDFVTTTADAFEGDNVLQGTIGGTAAASNIYVLAQPAGEVVGFYNATAGNVSGFKAYLETSAGVKGFAFKFDDDATGINEVNGQWSMVNGQSIFNLAGQRIQKMQKGINIMNGKKILK